MPLDTAVLTSSISFIFWIQGWNRKRIQPSRIQWRWSHAFFQVAPLLLQYFSRRYHLYSIRIHKIRQIDRKKQLTTVNRRYPWNYWWLEDWYVKLRVVRVDEKGPFSRKDSMIRLKLVVLWCVKLIVTMYHFLDAHQWMHNICIFHTDCTKVADQLIMTPCLIKLLKCLGVPRA